MKQNLARLLIIIALTFSVADGFSQSAPVKEKKKLGLQMYSLRDSLTKDLKATIEKLGKIGYKYMEAANFDNGKFYGLEPEAFKALIEANGMILVSGMQQWHGGICVLMRIKEPDVPILLNHRWESILLKIWRR